MSKFVFTPGQRDEALTWYKENCPELDKYIADSIIYKLREGRFYLLDLLIDAYFKMKSLSFPIKPEEFVIGVEYKNKEAVKQGKEMVNLRFHNPKRNEGESYDPFARDVLINLLMGLQS
jgi:hypothetical protein